MEAYVVTKEVRVESSIATYDAVCVCVCVCGGGGVRGGVCGGGGGG
jgi:hypothetical protein